MKIESKKEVLKIGIETSFLTSSNASKEKRCIVENAARFDTYYLSVAEWPKVVSSDDLFASEQEGGQELMLLRSRCQSHYCTCSLASHLA